jgi:hypothetical protein
MKPLMSKLDTALTILLRDFGYRFNGKDIVALPIRGFSGPVIIRQARDLFDAAEQLCPIVSNPEYTTRFVKLTTPSKD